MDYLLISVGLGLLFAGGEALVRGSVAISERLGISAILIGVVVVGFGTSTPELLVSIRASLAGQSDIALGNVVGSNIANVLLILGVSALICPVICAAEAIKRDALAVLVVSAALFALTFLGSITALIGALMIATLLAYLVYAYRAEVRDKKALPTTDPDTVHEHEAQEFSNKLGLGISVLMSGGGIIMLVFGADFLVEGASNSARKAGIPEAVIGLTLVAVGTSLPELAASISAARKKNSDVIIGNILGSNLFNILSILGITAIIKPVPLTGQIASFDVPLNLGIAALTLAMIYLAQKISRPAGVIFLASYAFYIGWLYTS